MTARDADAADRCSFFLSSPGPAAAVGAAARLHGRKDAWGSTDPALWTRIGLLP
jgi:hypothetical protein